MCTYVLNNKRSWLSYIVYVVNSPNTPYLYQYVCNVVCLLIESNRRHDNHEMNVFDEINT